MAWRAATVVLLAAATVPAAALPARAPRAPITCRTSGRTIASSSTVRVFRIGRAEEYRVYACVKHGPGGKVRRLGQYTLDAGANEFDGIDVVKVAGRFAAYETATCDHTGCGGEVKVLDVRTGRVLHHSLIPQGDFEIYVLVLRSSGSAAWSRRYSVTKVESGRRVVLDTGPQIDGNSLALHGSQLSWLSGGNTKTATLR